MTNHNETKEALEAAMNNVLTYRDTRIGTAAYTSGPIVTEGNNITPSTIRTTFAISDACKRAMDAMLDESAPAPAPSPAPAPAPAPAPPAPSTGNVYADALASLTLPATSQWIDTRPDYSAQVRITLDDGTTITVDTAAQAPDYAPYAGVWVYPFLLPDGTRHPDLTLNCYADCVKIGNTWVDAANNYRGHHVIKINGEVVEEADSHYDFGCFTAPCREGLPQPEAGKDWDRTLTPNYGTVPGGYASFAGQLAKADNGINGRSLTTPYNGMGNTGAQTSIGILHGAMVPFVVDGGDENWEVTRTIEDHANCWPIHLRDRVTGLPAVPCIPHCRDVTLLDYYVPGRKIAGGHINPVVTQTASPLKPDNAHCPGFGIVGFLATGSAQFLEELQFWAGYEATWANPYYRGYGKCISEGQVRGCAWQLRSKLYAARLTPPDHPLHGGLQTVIDENVKHFDAKYLDEGRGSNPFGIVGNEGSFDRSPAGNATSLAPWQQDFFAATVNQGVRMGFGNLTRLKAFVDIYTAARMGVGGPDKLWWTTAAFYEGCPRVPAEYKSQAAVTDEYVDDWAAFNRQNLLYNYDGAYADQADKSIDEADVGSGPGKPHGATGSPTNFWANFQPALAALGPDSPAWKLYAEKILPTQDYSAQGQFNVLPDVQPPGYEVVAK